MLGALKNKSYFVLKGIDLKGISKVTYNYAAKDNAATLEIHPDSAKGAVVSTLNYQPSGDWNKFKQATATITDPGGIHDLYFVFKKDGEIVGEGLCLLDWVKFGK
jgi:cytochrome c